MSASGIHTAPRTAASFVRWQPGTPAANLSAALFDGGIFVFRGLPAVADLVGRVRTLLADVFGTDDAPVAECRLAAREFARLALAARRRVDRDRVVDQLWRNVLASIGYRPESTWFDRLRLRVVPSRTDVEHPRLQALPAHRDTWGSGIMAQVNWWLPLYPLGKTRTMLLWPETFRRAVPNSSGNWSFDEFKRADGGYPLLPVAERHPSSPGTPVLIDPGDLLGFSAAHLHAGCRDDSGRTRFGIDSRSVWEPDRSLGRGAPNVDGALGDQMWHWFSAPPDRSTGAEPDGTTATPTGGSTAERPT